MRQQVRVTVGFVLGVVLVMVGMPSVGEAQTTTRVSVATGGGQANGSSDDDSSLSADGRFVVFGSEATNLVPGDTNGEDDVFVHDRQTGITTRVSVATGGLQGNGPSNQEMAMSADGRIVVFHSEATNLVPGDTNGIEDIFVHDRQTGVTTRVSVATGGGQALWNGQPNIGTSENATISADGRFVAFDSFANNLVSGDTNGQYDVFVHDRQTGVTTRVSVATGGGQASGGGVFEGSGNSRLSADGRFVAFQSLATNLVPGDTNGQADTFVHDRQTGVTTRVSVATGGGQASGGSSDEEPALSADGRFVAFVSGATNLVPGDTNGSNDAFVHDRQTGVTTRVSVATGGGQANGPSHGTPILSADGRFVVFGSDGTNLVPGDTNGVSDIFVHDRQTGNTSRISVATGGGQGNGGSDDGWLSQDGRFGFFYSDASNLVPGDTNGVGDIFIHDRGPASVPTIVIPAGIGDLDGNGTADVVWRDPTTGTVSVWFMNGLDVSRSAVLDTIPADWVIGGVGDLDGNGTADVVWRHPTTGIVAAWYMTSGTGAVDHSEVLASGLPADWIITGVGDLDGNGTADVVWRHVPSGLVAAWYMTLVTGLIDTSAVLDTIPADWVIGGVGDLDGNGTADVVWRHPTTGTVAAWYMTPGTGAVGSSAVLATGLPGDWIIGGMGDLDSNGTADVVWRHVPSGLVAAWLMTSGTGAVGSSGVISTIPADWIIAGMGDLNLGSGPADVVWHHPSSGTAAAWLMNALTVDDSGVISPP